MGPTDRLEMLINLDETGARSQIAALERRPLKVPLDLAGGRAGGRMPGGVRGIGGLTRGLPGMGRGGAIGSYMARGGAAQMILGGGMMAGMLLTQALDKKQTWGQVIASGVGMAGGYMMMAGAAAGPAGLPLAIAGLALSLGAPALGKLWDHLFKGKKTAGGIDLGEILRGFRKDLPFRFPTPPAGEDVVIRGAFDGPFGLTEPAAAPRRDVIEELQAALMQHDLIRELRAIRGLVARLVLQGSV